MAGPRPEPPDECSQCGAEIPRRALACPECGADEYTGWDANPYLVDGDMVVPDTVDHDPARDPPIYDHETWTARGWWLVAVVVVAVLLVVFLRH